MAAAFCITAGGSGMGMVEKVGQRHGEVRKGVTWRGNQRRNPDWRLTAGGSGMGMVEKVGQWHEEAAAIGSLTLALSTSPSSAQIRNMLCDEVSSGHIETEKKFSVLSTLFEYSIQSSCLTICLEALQ
ncbi:hypothetical protein V8G54_025018, partial [Vigna mungo]